MPALPQDPAPIVITASLAPDSAATSPASVSVLDGAIITRLGQPLVDQYLRLTPSAAITRSGPSGSLTEVRIRGAEANHTLLFMDGIKLNDPASGDIPRFELLNADLASRIEVVRGPQSALWGSDAIGGVVAINGLDDPRGYAANAEAGSFGERRASLSGGLRSDQASIAAGVGWQQARGIDSFGSRGGDQDGYRNLSARLLATAQLGQLRLTGAGLALTGSSQFDGYDPITFDHRDTLDRSRNRLAAGRVSAALGSATSAWAGEVAAALLGSTNRNFLAEADVNRTWGSRRTWSAKIERRLISGPLDHRLIIAVEDEREAFHARDTAYGGFTDQDRRRAHQSFTAEWRGALRGVRADLAIRRDRFAQFRDSTTWRAALLVPVADGVALRGSAARGIAAPTFFDLYGFFPGNFVGNPALKPESSAGFEAGVRVRKGPVSIDVAYYRQRLKDEIVDVFDPVTFLQTTENRRRSSRRSGVEVDARFAASQKLRLGAALAYLNASEPAGSTARLTTELRRPRWTGTLSADGRAGPISYGASIAYVGRHNDRRDSFPYDVVRLSDYWLADARIAYRVDRNIEVFVRGSNLINQHYQDSYGYRTEPRGLFAGLRWERR